MNAVRQPNVAGYFYPAEPNILRQNLRTLLAQAKNFDVAPPKAIIAPHAGYIYSGPIAATIYKTLLPAKDKITRVVLLGPAHRCGFLGIAITKMQMFATPLGNIAIDTAGVDQIAKLPNVQVLEQAYDGEHSLEVHLPFLQTVLNNFTLIPCVVGMANPEDVARVITSLWGGSETLIVVSSDLSHYHNYASAQKMDAATTQAIVNLQPNAIQDDQACGRLPVKGLLLAAANLQLQAQVLDLRNSGDTAGDKNRVVGYGAYHFN